MKNTKKFAYAKRTACLLLALVTLVCSIPAVGVSAAVDGTPRATGAKSITLNFEGAKAGDALTKALIDAEGFDGDGFSATNATNISYYADPTDPTNLVVGITNGKSNGRFNIGDDDGSLVDSFFTVEAKFYFTSLPAASASLIAWYDGSANDPFVRLKPSGALEMGNANSEYKETSYTVELNKWIKIRVDVDGTANKTKLYIDGEYIASRTFSASSTIKSIRILQDTSAYMAYVDDVSVYKQYGAAYDFEDATTETAIDTAYLNRGKEFTGEKVTNIAVFADPTDPDNMVIGHKTANKNGAFWVKDVDQSLLGASFSIEARVYIKSYPVSDGESGTPLSLFAWNNGSSNIPLVRVKKDGILQTRSSSEYSDTSVRVELDTWTRLTANVNAAAKTVALYVDGAFAGSSIIPEFTKSGSLRFLQSNGIWEIYMDDISFKKYNLVAYDEYYDFEGYTAGATAGQSLLSSAECFPNLSVSVGSSPKLTVDPTNPDNMTVHNTGDEMHLFLQDDRLRLPQVDFVVSADFMFDVFPTEKSTGADKPTSLFAWVPTNSSGTAYNILCRIDSNGNLLDRNNLPTGFVFEKNQWVNLAAHVNSKTGEYDIFVNGKPLITDDFGTPKTNITKNGIRILNSGQSAIFSAYVDNVQLYELEYVAKVDPSKVIWDVNFDNLEENAKLDTDGWSALSDVADAVYVGITDYSSVVTHNGSKALKVTAHSADYMLDLAVGNKDFDPLKNGSVKLSFKFTLDSAETGTGSHQLIRWRRFNTSKTGTALDILRLTNGKFIFCGAYCGFTPEIGKTYNVEIDLDSVNYGATLTIDGTPIVSGYPVTQTQKNISSSNAASTLDKEDNSYFLDDAGEKHYFPYSGYYKDALVDINGNAVTDENGNPVYVNKIYNRLNYYVDMFRMFQGVGGSSGIVYYVDDLKIQNIEKDEYQYTDFTGWDLLPAVKSSPSDRRYEIGGATMTNVDGNVYAQLPSVDPTLTGSDGQRHFWVGDRNKFYSDKDIYFETDIYMNNVSPTYFDAAALISLVGQKAGTTSDPFGWTSAGTVYTFLLAADGNGLLHAYKADGNKTAESIGSLNVGGWTKIGIALKTNGLAWRNMYIYIDGELVYSGTISTAHQNLSAMNAFRLTNVKGTILGYDNIGISVYKEKATPLALSFADDQTLKTAIAQLGTGWTYPAIDATRKNQLGVTVKSAEILGEGEDKFLRIDHTKVVSDSLAAYIDAYCDTFIDEDTYLIESAFRYTSTTASALNVAEIFSSDLEKVAPILGVRGTGNNLYITLKGVQYELVDSAGKPICAKNVNDTDFTETALLIDRANGTFTLYVDGRLAYYPYGDGILPCVGLSIHFIDNEVNGTQDYIRLLEIPTPKFHEAMLDVKYVNLRSTPNGLGAELKGSQTRTLLGTATFDVRFVSGIDTLYGNAVGYDVEANYTNAKGSFVKYHDISSMTVFDSINAGEGEISAAELKSAYLAAIEITAIPIDLTVTFKVKPYILRGETKVYGEIYEVTFVDGVIAG